MRVFDEIDPASDSVYRFGESLWTFANRSSSPAAKEVRLLVTSLLEGFPEPSKDELIKRLKSDEFEGAYFELIFHAVLRRHGAEVQIHSSKSSGNTNRPDFLAKFPNGQVAIFEAVVSRDMPKTERSAEAAWSQLFHRIDKIPSRYHIGLSLASASLPTRTPAPRRVVAFLQRRLEELDDLAKQDPLEDERDREARLRNTGRFIDDEITIDFSFILKENSRKPSEGSLGALPLKSRSGGSSKAIKKAVERKAGKYGDPKHPYIVVVNSLSPWVVTPDHEIEALFGGPHVEHGGALLRQDRTARNTLVSGVAIGSVLWRPGGARLRLYENPHAQRPCSAIPWRLDRMDRDGSTNVLESGESVGQILGLPAEWPGDFSS